MLLRIYNIPIKPYLLKQFRENLINYLHYYRVKDLLYGNKH